MNKQNWGSCAHAVGAGGLAYEILTMLPSCQALSESNFFEVYACENENVRKSGTYPVDYVEMHFMPNEYNPQQVAVLCRLADYGKKPMSKEDRKRFKSDFERGTAVCRDCRFYEPRGSELHPKSEVERTKKLTEALEVKTVS